tara:strand:- start:1615 stop:2019 length:405 start_codon:yes stop_codon:yes gene_type:complete
MFQRKQRRFRRRSNGRNNSSHHLGKEVGQSRMRSNSYSSSNGINRNNFRNSLSAEKLFEKYTSLAKEAMSSGDKTLSENYLQHADHFMRVIDEKNKSRIVSENKIPENNTQIENKQELPENYHSTQSNNSDKKS